MRTMLLEMRADGVAQTPLPELLRHLVEASGGRIGADVRLTVEGQGILPADVQTALYRIAQEALNNVARHAKASQGVGRPPPRRRPAHGWRSATTASGSRGSAAPGTSACTRCASAPTASARRFQVVSGAGRGTVVTVEWPLGEGEGDDV